MAGERVMRSLASRVLRRRDVAAFFVAALMTLGTYGLVGSAQAAGSLTLSSRSPASGPVGTLVTLTGTGFATRDVVMFNGRSTAPVSVNAAGTTLQARVPAFATSGLISVEDPSTGQAAELPNSPFTVTTGVFASPNRVWAGGRLTFSGSALSPDQTESIYIAGRRVGSVTTDRFGDFQIGVSVPWDEQSGKLSIYVIDRQYRTITTILFILGAWPEFRHDSAHLGVQTWETSLTPSSVAKLAQKWSFPTGASVTASPVVANGILYYGSKDDTLYARNAGTGKSLWSYATDSSITSTPAVDNNRVFVLSSSGAFYALNATTGKYLWKQPTDGGSDSSPVTANGVVYVGSYYDGNLDAFNEVTGKMLWLFHTNGPLDSPAVANGIVYVGSQDGYVYALNAATGAQIWKHDTGKIVESSPAVAAGHVYIGTEAGTLYSLSASTGAVTWARTPDHWAMEDSPAVAGGYVFIATNGERLYSFSTATGTVKWSSVATDLESLSSPSIADGVLYIGDSTLGGGGQYNIAALDSNSGKTLWTKAVGGTDASPAVSNGMLYVDSDNDWVYAFGL